MKRVLLALSIAMIAIFTTSYAQLTTTPPSNANQIKTKGLNLLFIQTAKTAILQSYPQQPGYFLLTLYNVNPYITYFSQRPNRVKGFAPVDNFVKAWDVGDNSFKNNNPNAVLMAGIIDQTPNTTSTTYIFSLSQPQYDSKRLITRYLAKPLPAENLFFKQMNFENVTLLID